MRREQLLTCIALLAVSQAGLAQDEPVRIELRPGAKKLNDQASTMFGSIDVLTTTITATWAR